MVRNLSKSGVAFATLFAIFSAWCITSALNGAWQATQFIFYITLPFSLAIGYLCAGLQLLIGLPFGVLNWIVVALDVMTGMLEFYFLGWLLERPFRR